MKKGHVKPKKVAGETKRLRRKLADVQAELSFYRGKHDWLVSALSAQRHARQLLEAGVSASYTDTISRIREVVASVVPPASILIVVSKGDQELLRFEQRKGWHFPQTKDGVYAGHYPATSKEAISELESLMAKGGGFLLLPNTSFWWLEHYSELKEWLESFHTQLWRDERCAIYRLRREVSVTNRKAHIEPEFGARAISPPTPASVSIPLNHNRRIQASIGQRPDILCFPIIDWDFRFQRPQQLMLRFAAGGHRVFYLSHRFRKSGATYSLRQVAPSLWEVSLRGPGYNIHQNFLDEGSRTCLCGALSGVCQEFALGDAVTLVQSPFWWPLAKQLVSTFNWSLVYDCMDYHAGFSTSNPLLVEHERELLSEADLVVASSANLRTYARRYAQKVVIVRNGCDYRHFAMAATKPKQRRPVIGYYGAIAEWFDSDLVADLAQRRRDWDFILVGSTLSADMRRLTELPNVSFPGEKSYAQLPKWLAKFDVAILPFKRTPLTEAANPVKAYEIFAAGKPLVSVPLPEMIPMKTIAHLASTVDEFEKEIQNALNQSDLNLRRRRQAFARKNTWEERYETFCSEMQQFLASRPCYRPESESLTPLPAHLV